MSSITAGLPSNYLTHEHTVRSWLLTTDHKRIALLFFASITFFFFVGGFAATLIRLHLVNPAGTLLQPDMYNRMFTMHGIVMVWFFLIPSIPAGPFTRRSRPCTPTGMSWPPPPRCSSTAFRRS